MSATNRTTYYNLPIFIGTDVPSWLGDWNDAMNDIDSAIQSVNSKAEGANTTAQSANNDAQTLKNTTVPALQHEVDTIKQAVMNYDNILNFKQQNTSFTTNNMESWIAGAMYQNTNKTLSRVWFYGRFNKPLNNPVTYIYNDNNGTHQWYDVMTVEDNCYNLTQSSQPNNNTCLTLGAATRTKVGDSQELQNVYFNQIKAWFDGATTHIGLVVNNSDVQDIPGGYLMFNGCIFLAGSVYNPDIQG